MLSCTHGPGVDTINTREGLGLLNLAIDQPVVAFVAERAERSLINVIGPLPAAPRRSSSVSSSPKLYIQFQTMQFSSSIGTQKCLRPSDARAHPAYGIVVAGSA
jgi:hypothetical protein